jgi:SAM-dependent methyltransferase
MSIRDHWEGVYQGKGAERVSWFRPHLERSLDFIDGAGLSRESAIIDVGGGASTLVDDLLARSYTDITVLDLSATAIEVAKARLGSRAGLVHWIVGDVCAVELPERAFDFWHDRAVFHFLRAEEQRRRYVEAVLRSLKPGGHVVVATFGLEGPERCSGLEVARYDANGLHAEFGSPFVKLSSATEVHQTPWGSEQQFVYCYCRAR